MAHPKGWYEVCERPVFKVMIMSIRKMKRLISILMESPLYLTLTLKERDNLVRRVAESYPSVVADGEEESAVGYESSWAGVTRPK